MGTAPSTATKTLTATDPDAGDVLTFTLLSGPAGMTLSGQTLSWTPTSAQLGNWPVRVKVTDKAGLSASGQFNVGIQFLVATDDAYQVVLGQTLTVNGPGVLANKTVAVIGPTTAAEAVRCGLSPVVAEEPNIDALISAIVRVRSPKGDH